jgi:hypothetical protein
MSCLESWDYDSADERVAGVEYLLQGNSDRSRVFYYRSYFDNLPPDAPEDNEPAVNPKVSYLTSWICSCHDVCSRASSRVF